MNKKLLFGLLIVILAILPLCIACTTASTSSTVSSTAGTSSITSTTTPPVTTGTTTTAANWWSSFGEPQYGGTINIRVNSLNMDMDPATSWGGLYQYYGDYLWQGDWTLDRSIWGFQSSFAPDKYWIGCLVDTWEMTDAKTLTVHLKQGVHWQNTAPVNGREFVADDVQQHYDRILGTGSGYTAPNAFSAGRLTFLDKAVATDKYTVSFYFKKPTATGFIGLAEQAGQNWVEAPEEAKLADGFKDWKYGVGTGPWIISDFVSGNSASFTRNSSYSGVDPRYPKNKLPYADQLKVFLIADASTAEAALRTGKVDIMDGLGWQSAKTMGQNDPELLQAKLPANGASICLRVDNKPFTDINVRKALQMAVDLKTIAQSHYGGMVDGTPACIFSPMFKGYTYAYADWPQSLKDEYAFNTAKAKELLTTAGYPNGFDTNIYAGTNNDLALIQIFKAEFADIGVNMTINTVDAAAFMNFAIAKKHDQMITGTCARTFPPQMDLAGFNATDRANYSNVQDTAYGDIFNNFMNSTTVEDSQKYSIEAEKYALEQHWMVTTFTNATFNIYQPYLKGYSGEAFTPTLWSKLWIDQSMKK